MSRSKLRKRALAAVKKKMIADGEIEDFRWDDSHPRNAKERILREARAAFDDAGYSRDRELTKNWDDRVAMARDAWRRKAGQRAARRNFSERATAEIRRGQRRAGADEKGIKYVDIESGAPCRIVPKIGLDRFGNEYTIEDGFKGWPSGTYVTALWDRQGAAGWLGNRDLTCMMPNGEYLSIPKTRLHAVTPDEFDDDDDDIWEDDEETEE